MSTQSPDSTADSKPIEDKALDTQDVIDLLAEGEDDGEVQEETLELGKTSKGDAKGDKEEKEGEGKEEKELSLEEELEEELKTPDDEDLELVDVPRRKEILAAFPDLFKKFPQLEKAMYRERAYSEIGSIEEVKAAVEKAQTLDEHEAELGKGTIAGILGVVHGGDKEIFAKVVDDYMPALYRTDQGAYYHTIGNIVKHTIISMVNDAKQRDDENLSNAAAVLNEYMFGTTKFTHPTRLSKEQVQDGESKEKEDKVSEREQTLNKREFDNALGSLDTRVTKVLSTTVEKYIDPKESMTAYTRKNAVKQVQDELEAAISNDVRFKKVYDTMWLRAKDNGYGKEHMDKLYRAYLSKAQTLLPGIISKVRKEVMGDSKGKPNGNDRKERDRRGPLPVGKNRGSTPTASGSANTGSSSKTPIPKGMTTLEYLNSDD